MKHSRLTPQFFVTAPQPCPYLSGQVERKLFTAIYGEDGAAINNALSTQGFRRSQNVVYRPSCVECSACMSARVDVTNFTPSRSQKRVLKRNAHLNRRPASAWATEEQYEVFRRYLDSRHSHGGMADMDLFEFATMVEETPIRSRVVEYYDEDDAGLHRSLRAACLTDILGDGLSMVYSFFDPDLQKNSIGSYMILDHIMLAREMGFPYLYLGYWVKNSPKMDYKSNFTPLEVFNGEEWLPVAEAQEQPGQQGPISVEPIAEQIARIKLSKSPE